jgi:hypothetical protein
MNDTQFILIEAAISVVWLACVLVCFLKGKPWSGIIGIVTAIITAIDPTIGGWYIFHLLDPIVLLPIPAAIRLARPDSYWACWFYRNRPNKYMRAVMKYNMVQEYLELQRRVENETKEKPE